MITATVRINRQELNALNRAFDRSLKVGDHMIDLAQEYALRIAQEAQQRSFAVSSRISSSFVLEQQNQSEGFVSVMVASQFVGYPTSDRDNIGSAVEASARGWATFTHRYDLGFSGNPRAGYTPAHGFLTRPFEQLSGQWADKVIERAISVWVGRR